MILSGKFSLWQAKHTYFWIHTAEEDSHLIKKGSKVLARMRVSELDIFDAQHFDM